VVSTISVHGDLLVELYKTEKDGSEIPIVVSALTVQKYLGASDFMNYHLYIYSFFMVNGSGNCKPKLFAYIKIVSFCL